MSIDSAFRRGISIMPIITLKYVSLKDYGFTSRISHLRDIYLKLTLEIFIVCTRLITGFMLHRDFFSQKRFSVLDKARTYRCILKNQRPIVRHDYVYDNETKLFEFKEVPFFGGSTTKGFGVYVKIKSQLCSQIIGRR
jgi:hypothetical protein